MNFRDLLLAAKNNDNIAFETILKMYEPLIMKESIIEYSAKVEHPDRFELNSATAQNEQSNRQN